MRNDLKKETTSKVRRQKKLLRQIKWIKSIFSRKLPSLNFAVSLGLR